MGAINLINLLCLITATCGSSTHTLAGVSLHYSSISEDT